MRIQLQVKAKALGEMLLWLEWADGELVEHVVIAGLRPALDRWRCGISEWLGEWPDAVHRETTPDDPEFLRRLDEHLRQQSGLTVELM